MRPDKDRTGKPMQNPSKSGGKAPLWLRRSLISLAENCQGSRSVRENHADIYQYDGRFVENRAARFRAPGAITSRNPTNELFQRLINPALQFRLIENIGDFLRWSNRGGAGA